MRQDEEQLDGVVYGPVVRERLDRYGSVPGLPDDELADPDDLAWMALVQDWAPILALPCRYKGSGIKPAHDELGHLDFGAFATVDFQRMYPFDKARYKVQKLREQLRYACIRLEGVIQHVPAPAKYLLLRHLQTGVLSYDQIEDFWAQATARWYLRACRLRQEIREVEAWRRSQQQALLADPDSEDPDA